jgi:uncharacterized protein YxeA
MKRKYVLITILLGIVIIIVSINLYMSLIITHEENNNYNQNKPVLRRSNAWTEEDIARIEKQLNKKLRNEKQEESYSFKFD